MAKIDNNNNAKKNSNKMPVGTMSKEKLARFKLHGNFADNRPKVVCRNAKKVAKSVRLMTTYRMYVHGVAETKLPSQLRQVAHYFLIPMSRSDSDNSKDRKGFVVENTDNNSVETLTEDSN